MKAKLLRWIYDDIDLHVYYITYCYAQVQYAVISTYPGGGVVQVKEAAGGYP